MAVSANVFAVSASVCAVSSCVFAVSIYVLYVGFICNPVKPFVMVVLSTPTDTPNDVLLNPDEDARFTCNPVDNVCSPELVPNLTPINLLKF